MGKIHRNTRLVGLPSSRNGKTLLKNQWLLSRDSLLFVVTLLAMTLASLPNIETGWYIWSLSSRTVGHAMKNYSYRKTLTGRLPT